MIRRLLVVTFVLAGAGALARDRLADTQNALAALADGSMSATQVANKISNAGTEAEATMVLTKRLQEISSASLQSAYFEVLAQIAVPSNALNELAGNALRPGKDITLRLNAMRVIARMKLPGAPGILTPMLNDRSLGVRREAARGLTRIGNARSAQPLLVAAKTEDDPETRALMIVGVGKLGDVKQAKGLESLLESSSESTRLAATQALCLLGNKKGFETAKALLASKEKFERLQGVTLFEGASAKVAAPLLTPMLGDADTAVKARAGRILAQGGDGRLIEWLVLESFKASTDEKLVFETELELLRVTDETRGDILRKAGLKK
jgi:hypothetical protein